MKYDMSGKGGVSKEFRSILDELKIENKNKKDVYDAIESISTEIISLEGRRDRAEKMVHPKYNKLDTIDKGLK